MPHIWPPKINLSSTPVKKGIGVRNNRLIRYRYYANSVILSLAYHGIQKLTSLFGRGQIINIFSFEAIHQGCQTHFHRGPQSALGLPSKG